MELLMKDHCLLGQKDFRSSLERRQAISVVLADTVSPWKGQ